MQWLKRWLGLSTPTKQMKPQKRITLSVENLEQRDVPSNLVFIGNSYTAVADRPGIRLDAFVRDIAAVAGQTAPNVTSRFPGGYQLEQHAAELNTTNIRDFVPPGQNAFAVVLQGQSLEATSNYAGTQSVNEFIQGAADVASDVRGAFPAAKLVLMQTWARPFPNSDPNVYQFYSGPNSMQDDISSSYRSAGINLRNLYGKAVEIAPVGEAYRLLGFNNNLHLDSGGHPNERGALVAALTLYATIYDDNVSDISAAAAAQLLGVRGLNSNDWNAAVSAADRAVGSVRSLENLNFVRTAYVDILGREVDAVGQNQWHSFLNSGVLSRSQLVTQLTYSDEYRDKFIQGRYNLILNRGADTGGYNNFMTQLRNGAANDFIRVQLLASDEFFIKSGNTPTGFIQQLYQIGMSRSASQEDINFWTARMNEGLSRFEVASSVINSRENRERQVRNLYTGILGRNADAGGLDFYATALQTGTRFQDVVIMFTRSYEYFLRNRTNNSF